MIWEFALPGERIIRVSQYTVRPPCPHVHGAQVCTSSCPIQYLETKLSMKPEAGFDTAILRVCHEARSIALKYYQPAFGGHFGLKFPIYYCPDTDKVSFTDPGTLYMFATQSGQHPEALKVVKQSALRDIYIESIPETGKRYLPPSLLSFRGNTLDEYEIIGFACMRLATVKNIILNRRMSAGFGKQAALDAPCWEERRKVEQGIHSYIAWWMQRTGRYSFRKDDQLEEKDLPLDYRSWEYPEVKAFLAKYTARQPPPFSSTQGLACDETALWTREEVEKLW